MYLVIIHSSQCILQWALSISSTMPSSSHFINDNLVFFEGVSITLHGTQTKTSRLAHDDFNNASWSPIICFQDQLNLLNKISSIWCTKSAPKYSLIDLPSKISYRKSPQSPHKSLTSRDLNRLFKNVFKSASSMVIKWLQLYFKYCLNYTPSYTQEHLQEVCSKNTKKWLSWKSTSRRLQNFL